LCGQPLLDFDMLLEERGQTFGGVVDFGADFETTPLQGTHLRRYRLKVGHLLALACFDDKALQFLELRLGLPLRQYRHVERDTRGAHVALEQSRLVLIPAGALRHFGKRVVGLLQRGESVPVRCADNPADVFTSHCAGSLFSLWIRHLEIASAEA
jgi:hypothetical protein